MTRDFNGALPTISEFRSFKKLGGAEDISWNRSRRGWHSSSRRAFGRYFCVGRMFSYLHLRALFLKLLRRRFYALFRWLLFGHSLFGGVFADVFGDLHFASRSFSNSTRSGN